ncbi:hypothetical protein QM012_008173 [Aureobasidium pullulans]|uniref:Zn(2)-C6 fungal-type domain-containing protein n=1 Tax=Aureobasidium pullulans TaxID=5580 RepID=A0ABR0TKA9_AURPU
MSQAAEEPPRKRQRVTQACHRCRCKKYKCDSERPTCSTCRASNSECTYGTVAKRRGLQSGYVRAVEILWGLVFKKVAGSQNAINDLLVDLSSILNPGPSDATTNDNVSYRADDLLERWRNSGVPSAIEMMLDGTFTSNQVGVSEDMDNAIDTTLSSVPAWSLAQSDLLQGTPPRPPSPLPRQPIPPPAAAAIMSDASFPLEDMFAKSQPALSPLPSDWHSLTQIYFTVEYSWIPCLERHDLFRTAYQYQDESESEAAFGDRRRGEYAILWAVLTLGEIHSTGISSSRATQFESRTRHFLDKDPVQENYATYAQAFLLLSMIHLGRGKSVLARSTVAQALVFFIAGRTGKSERQCAFALSGCFVLDTLLAAATDTRPLMSVNDLHSSLPCDESGSDEWEPYVGRFGQAGLSDTSSAGTSAVPSRVSSTYNHLVKLFCILNTAMQKPTSEHDLTADIEAWRLNLPQHLTMIESLSRQTPKSVLPPLLHLRAFYWFVLYIAATKDAQRQSQTPSTGPQAKFLDNSASSLVQIDRRFGTQAIPASISALIPFLLSRVSSMSLHYVTATTNTDSVINKYKALWGWVDTQYHDDQDLTEATLLDQSGRQPPSPSALQNPLDAAIHCEIPHTFPATFDAGTGAGYTNEQAIGLGMIAAGETDTAGINLSQMATSGFDDVAASGTDSILADTPTQLLDYLALLQENESVGNSQDFMQSLGFFMEFDGANT